MADVLVVEDDRTLGMTLEMSLGASGHAVRLYRSLEAARRAVADRMPDLVILDLGLPDGNGLDLCRELRAAGRLTPIVILTAKDLVHDRVEGLEVGADDYVTKPFELPEVLARVEAALRRQRWHGGGARVQVGRLVVDFERHEAFRDGEKLALTDLELRLLQYLVERAGRTISRGELIEAVWGLPASTRTRSVDVFMGRLRRYVEPEPSRPRHILNVRGVGYRLLIAGGPETAD